jgi:hypothetical protein
VKNSPKPKKQTSPTALKHARLFLRHLPAIRRDWENAAQMCTVETDGAEIVRDTINYENFSSVIRLIDQTKMQVQAFLEACTLPHRQTPNPAAFIADAAQTAWERVETDAIPKANGPGDPLCLFVTEAMSLAGKTLSPETVSDMLRDRHQRKRSAKRVSQTRSKARG